MASSSSTTKDNKVQMETNPRGIPRAPFVETVEEYVTEAEPVEIVLKKFQEAVAKYKFMEVNMMQRKKNLDAKIPEIQKTLEMVTFLQEQGQKALEEGDEDQVPEIETMYELNDTLFATAKIKPTGSVCLWLGANVMLEYPVDEAVALLTSKLETAQKTLTNTEEDMAFLRDQVTTMEVNTARVYNWDVKQRRLLRAKNNEESSAATGDALD